MATITRTIEADKDGIITMLTQERTQTQEQKETASTRRERDRLGGRADGLWFALAVLRDWDDHPLFDADDLYLLSDMVSYYIMSEYGGGDHGHTDHPEDAKRIDKMMERIEAATTAGKEDGGTDDRR